MLSTTPGIDSSRTSRSTSKKKGRKLLPDQYRRLSHLCIHTRTQLTPLLHLTLSTRTPSPRKSSRSRRSSFRYRRTEWRILREGKTRQSAASGKRCRCSLPPIRSRPRHSPRTCFDFSCKSRTKPRRLFHKPVRRWRTVFVFEFVIELPWSYEQCWMCWMMTMTACSLLTGKAVLELGQSFHPRRSTGTWRAWRGHLHFSTIQWSTEVKLKTKGWVYNNSSLVHMYLIYACRICIIHL